MHYIQNKITSAAAFMSEHTPDVLKPVFLFSVSEAAYNLSNLLHDCGMLLTVFYTGFKLYTELKNKRNEKRD